jgi:hypothetical protein
MPLAWSRSYQSTLCGDRDATVRVESFHDQLFAAARAVRVGSVYEIDAKLNCALQNPNCSTSIWRIVPDSRAGKAHGSVAQPGYWQIAAEKAGTASGWRPELIDH